MTLQLIHTTYSIILRTEVANRIKCSKEEKEIIELEQKVILSSKLSSNYKHLETSPKNSRDQIWEVKVNSSLGQQDNSEG